MLVLTLTQDDADMSAVTGRIRTEKDNKSMAKPVTSLAGDHTTNNVKRTKPTS